MWDPQVPALSVNRRLIRFDLRGHGRSPVPPGPYTIDELGGDVLALLDRFGVGQADYVGLSIGGMLGIWLAVNAPERIRRLVIICSSAKVNAAVYRERAATVLSAGSASVVAPAVVERWFTPEYASANPALIERMRGMIAATPATGYAGCCEAIATMDLTAGVARIGVPTLVIAAAQDRALPAAEHGELVARAIPGARFELLQGAAHLVTIEQSAAVNRLILDHLDGPLRAAVLTDAARREQGMRVRRAVLGDAHVDRAIASTTAFTAPFQDFITRVAWGEVWARDELDRRTRSAITLAVLAALGREGELELHVRAAIRNGLSPAEIAEVLLHTSLYAGVPAANAALAVARRVLSEDGLL
jgi:3-oxoadipate enol-lactonase/4-carboxymuconolactone decarboxylase